MKITQQLMFLLLTNTAPCFKNRQKVLLSQLFFFFSPDFSFSEALCRNQKQKLTVSALFQVLDPNHVK